MPNSARLFTMRTMFEKRIFDPCKRDDLRAYKQYIQTQNWGPDGCPFELEWPWTDVPNMLAHKIAAKTVEKIN